MSLFPNLPSFKPPSLPSLPFSRGSGNGAGQGTQSLSGRFGDFMQNSPLRMLSQIFPDARVPATTPGTPSNATTPTTPQAPANPGQTGQAAGTNVGFTPPLGPSIPLPAPPGFGNRGTNPGNPTNTMPPGPAPTGLLAGAGNLVSNAVGSVVNLLNPAAAAANPATPPGTPIPAAGNPAPAGPLGNLANAVLAPVRALFNGAPVAPTVVSPPTANAIASNLPTQQATTAMPAQAPTTVQAPIAQPATAQSAPLATQGPPASMVSAPLTQSQTPPTSAAPLSQQQMASMTQPQRADAALTPQGNPAADRAALAAQAPPPAQVPAQSAPQVATLLAAAVPIASTIAQTPAGQQVPGNMQIAGTTQATPPAAGEKGGVSRADMPMIGMYTADGPGLRRRNRLRLGPAQLGEWVVAMSQGRLQLVRPEDDTPNEVAKAMQWVFWTLAIVAYGCIGLVLVAVLLQHGDAQAVPALRQWTGEFSLVGLIAAVGAWWLGRRIMATSTVPNPSSSSPRGTRRDG